MLSAIRSKVTGIIAGIIVGALVLSFALWGVQSYFGIGSEPTVAKVNDEPILLSEFQRSLSTMREQMKQVLGAESFTEEEESFIQEQTIRRMIGTELVNQVVDEVKLYSTNDSVQTAIANLDFFKDDNGAFSQARYESVVRQLGKTPRGFEEDLRKDLLSEQLQAGLAETIFVTSNESNQLLKLKNQMRDISYLRISVDDYLDSIESTDKEIEDFYNTNKALYQESEKVKISYIELSVDELAKDIEVNEEQAREYYLENKDVYDVTEQRSVTKLSVKFDEEKSDEYNQKALADLEAVLEKAKSGVSLEEIVSATAADKTSKLQFTEHGFMLKGVMPKEIDEYLFAANEGDVSDIIKMDTGAHIVAVGQIKGGPKNVYESVAERVQHDYKRTQAQRVYAEKYDEIATLSFEQPDSLEPAAEAVGVTLNETDYIYRDNKDENNKVLSNPKVIEQSFTPDLRELGVNSEPVEISDEHIVVLRVNDYQEARTKELDEVKEDVIEDLKQDKARALAKKAGDEVLEKLKVGETKEVVTPSNLEWQDGEAITRDDTTITRAVLRKAFAMPYPSEGLPSYDATTVSGGDYTVIVLSKVTEGNVEDSKQIDVDNAELDILRRNSGAEWETFMLDLEENSEVSIMTDNI